MAGAARFFIGFLTTSVTLLGFAAWLTVGQTGTLDWSLASLDS